MLKLDKVALEEAVARAAPIVQELTGLDPHLQTVSADRISRKNYLRLRKRHDAPANSLSEYITRTTQRLLASAAYYPPSKTIYFIEETYYSGVGIEEIMPLAGHELTHHTHREHSPSFYAAQRINDRELAEYGVSRATLKAARYCIDEGDAYHVTGQLRRRLRVQRALPSFRYFFTAELVNAVKPELTESLETGRRFIQHIEQKYGREGVNSLFADPVTATQIFSIWVEQNCTMSATGHGQTR